MGSEHFNKNGEAGKIGDCSEKGLSNTNYTK